VRPPEVPDVECELGADADGEAVEACGVPPNTEGGSEFVALIMGGGGAGARKAGGAPLRKMDGVGNCAKRGGPARFASKEPCDFRDSRFAAVGTTKGPPIAIAFPRGMAGLASGRN
jgi:hypothetical protein